MHAVIATGGKQYRVAVGDTLDVEKLEADDAATVSLRPVMLIDDDGELTVGRKALEQATVTARVVEQRKERKIVVFKYKNKTGYRRTAGHRQRKTRITVDEISA
ncbi:MAG: 50S ribosomal protein L21 [Egibacteraceae bacterium]